MKNENQENILEKKFQPKKVNNLKTVDYIWKFVTPKNLEMINDCSTYLKFASETPEAKSKKKLVQANACKNRFCPVCTWRKARKDSFKIGTLLEVMRLVEKKEFIFLTLTTPNIKSDKVNDMIDLFNHSCQKLFQRKKVKGAVKGYIRKLEMTYNEERDDFNPHFHLILAVNKSYFKKPEQYIPHAEWLDIWRDVTGIEEITQVDVRKVNMMRGSAVEEVAKYSAKDTDMLQNESVFDTFYRALKGKRLLVYSGIFKEYNQKFENGELEEYIQRDKTDYFYLLSANWDWKTGKYTQAYREMTEEEREKYKKINEHEDLGVD